MHARRRPGLASGRPLAGPSGAVKWQRIGILVLALFGAVGVWAAIGTVPGYFWLNRVRLEALVAEVAAVPAIDALELGQENSLDPGGRDRSRLFDSYRFINGMVVTHHREQVAPGAEQPVYDFEDVLARLGVPAARYWHLRKALKQLGLSGYRRLSAGRRR